LKVERGNERSDLYEKGVGGLSRALNKQTEREMQTGLHGNLFTGHSQTRGKNTCVKKKRC